MYSLCIGKGSYIGNMYTLMHEKYNYAPCKNGLHRHFLFQSGAIKKDSVSARMSSRKVYFYTFVTFFHSERMTSVSIRICTDR